MSDILIEIKNAIVDGQNAIAKEKVETALKQGLNPEDILNTGMVKAMAEVGWRFERGESFVPEMLLAARAMQSGLVILRGSLVKANFKATGKVAIGTVKGDLHDIGKNLVSMMLEGAGFDILDMGTETAGLRDRVKVIVGGAPVTEAYAKQIGADGFSLNAARAVNVAKELVGED